MVIPYQMGPPRTVARRPQKKASVSVYCSVHEKRPRVHVRESPKKIIQESIKWTVRVGHDSKETVMN